MFEDHPIIIIGSGMAGYNVAREFRKLNTDAELIIIADDAADFYSKPLLSNALAKNKLAHELAMASAEKMADDLNAKILKHTRVEKIEPENNCIYTQCNKILKYRHLVLALGGTAIELPIDGNAADKILSVNHLSDYAKFRHAITDKSHVAIIGAGLIGCEFANDLALADYDVTVIDLSDLPLSNLLPPQAGEYLKKALSEQGVKWHLGNSTEHIHYENTIFNIELADGTQLEADVVLSAVGLKPNTKIAEEAGIHINKGIKVNQQLQTNYSNIFALGDCAEIDGLLLPYVMPLMNSARAIAKSLNDELTTVNFPAMPVMLKTPSCTVVASPAARHIQGKWIIEQDDEGVHASYVDQEGVLQGFALVGKSVADKQRLVKELPAVLD